MGNRTNQLCSATQLWCKLSNYASQRAYVTLFSRNVMQYHVLSFNWEPLPTDTEALLLTGTEARCLFSTLLLHQIQSYKAYMLLLLQALMGSKARFRKLRISLMSVLKLCPESRQGCLQQNACFNTDWLLQSEAFFSQTLISIMSNVTQVATAVCCTCKANR